MKRYPSSDMILIMKWRHFDTGRLMTLVHWCVAIIYEATATGAAPKQQQIQRQQKKIDMKTPMTIPAITPALLQHNKIGIMCTALKGHIKTPNMCYWLLCSFQYFTNVKPSGLWAKSLTRTIYNVQSYNITHNTQSYIHSQIVFFFFR